MVLVGNPMPMVVITVQRSVALITIVERANVVRAQFTVLILCWRMVSEPAAISLRRQFHRQETTVLRPLIAPRRFAMAPTIDPMGSFYWPLTAIVIAIRILIARCFFRERALSLITCR